MKYLSISLLAISLFFSSCGEKLSECVFTPETKSIELTVEIEQLQEKLVSITTKDELVELLSNNPLLRDDFFRRPEYPNDSVFINTLYAKFSNPHMDTLLMETKRVFGDASFLETEFHQAFTNLKYYYPDFTPPKIQTVISGLDNDLYVSDSLIIISLDFYLGPTARYRPQMYDYLLRQYVKENIVPSCLLLFGISDLYNATNPSDRTVVADMVAYGKSYYFAKHMLPCKADSILMNYSAEEISEAKKFETLIWYRIIEDKILFSTSHIDKQHFLGDRPKTIEVGEDCPGRIGQWVGWQIVNKYMKDNPEVTLPQLMQMSDAQLLFKESKYRPK